MFDLVAVVAVCFQTRQQSRLDTELGLIRELVKSDNALATLSAEPLFLKLLE
jgi:hypothetical protein